MIIFYLLYFLYPLAAFSAIVWIGLQVVLAKWLFIDWSYCSTKQTVIITGLWSFSCWSIVMIKIKALGSLSALMSPGALKIPSPIFPISFLLASLYCAAHLCCLLLLLPSVDLHHLLPADGLNFRNWTMIHLWDVCGKYGRAPHPDLSKEVCWPS